MTVTPAPATGEELFGRYRLLTKLAAGGMGEIFLARLDGEGGFAKLVVIKRLLPELVASEEFRAMFLHEARIAGQLSHANICDVYELGQVGEQYFIAMAYLQGVSLSRIARDREQPVDTDHVRMIAGLGEQACEGLHHAHELTGPTGERFDLVHRDVSPSNLLATFDGVLKVLDFGIAKVRGVPRMTTKGSIRGKFAYMSPEQIRGDEVDRRSDIFSLATVLFETLTHRRMFQRNSEYLIARAILEEDYPDAREVAPAVPPVLAAVLARALARRPEDRFANAQAMGAALREAVAELGGPLPSPAIGDRLRRLYPDSLAEQRGQLERATSRVEAAPPVAGRGSDDAGRGVEVSTEPVPRPGSAHAEPTETTAPTRLLRGSGSVPVERAEATPTARVPGRPPAAAIGAVVLLLAGAATLFWLLRRPDGTTRALTADAGISSAPDERGSAAAPPAELPADAAPAADAESVAAPAVDAGRPVRRRPHRRSHGEKVERPSPTAEPGYFSIDSTPFAIIYIDGERVGETPIIHRALSPGKHQVRAVTEDGHSRSFSIRVRSGRETPKRLDW